MDPNRSSLGDLAGRRVLGALLPQMDHAGGWPLGHSLPSDPIG